MTDLNEDKKPPKVNVLALDLEGTLISDVFSRVPRPRLLEFLEFCHNSFPRIVIFTGASEKYFREVARELVNNEKAPFWFSSLEYIHWDKEIKDLRFIPDADPKRCILIDDYPSYIHPQQINNWIPINLFT